MRRAKHDELMHIPLALQGKNTTCIDSEPEFTIRAAATRSQA